MALTYNSSTPSKITYNESNVSILKLGETAVWAERFNLSINQGTNSRAYVQRTESICGSIGELSNGDAIYYGDKLTLAYSCDAPYEMGTHTINDTTFAMNYEYIVTGNVAIATTRGSVKQFTVATDWDTVFSARVYRTSSPYGGASSGLILSSGAASVQVYYGDVLQIKSHERHYTDITLGGLINRTITDAAPNVVYESEIIVTDHLYVNTRWTPIWRTIWTGWSQNAARNGSVWVGWPTNINTIAESYDYVKIIGKLDFRGIQANVSKALSAFPASAELKYSGTSKSTVTMKDPSWSGYRLESTGNNYDGYGIVTQIDIFD